MRLGRGSRVHLLDDEALFLEAFSRFPNDEVNGLNPAKLEKLGQEAEILEAYSDHTVKCKFDDGAMHDMPVEALDYEMSIIKAAALVQTDAGLHSREEQAEEVFSVLAAGGELDAPGARTSSYNELLAQTRRHVMLVWIDAELGRDLALQIYGHILSTVSPRFLVVAEDIPSLSRSLGSARPGPHDGWSTFLLKQPQIARELRNGLGYVHAVIGFGLRHGSVHNLLQSVSAMQYLAADTALRFVAVENEGRGGGGAAAAAAAAAAEEGGGGTGGGDDHDAGSKNDSQWLQPFSEVSRQLCHYQCTQLHNIKPTNSFEEGNLMACEDCYAHDLLPACATGEHAPR